MRFISFQFNYYFMPKTYSQLKESSKGKLANTLERLHKSGITVKDTLVMSDSQLKQSLGFKGKKTSFEGLKRNIRQLQFDQQRQEGISNRSLTSYAKSGYRGKGLSRVKSQLRKTVGLNIFFDISKKVQSTFNLTTNQSYKQTSLILRKARTNFRNLSKREKEILSFFS